MASDTPNTSAEQEQQDIDVEKGRTGHVPRSGDVSFGDILSHPDTQTELKFIGWIYALIGFGFGLLMLIVDSQFLGDGVGAEMLSGVISAVLFGLLIFIGPVIAALTTLDIVQRFENRPKYAWVTSAIGNGGGFLIMVVITVLFVNSVFTGEGGELFNLSNLLVPLVLLAIPPAIVGVGAAYVYDRVRNR